MNDKMKTRIEQLLRKAESTDSPAEAEALTAAAEKLMIREGIDRALLDIEGDANRVKTEKIVTRHIEFGGWEQGAWKQGMPAVVRALGLQTYISRNRGIVFAMGFESDVDACLELLESLRVQSVHAMKVWWKNEGLPLAKRLYFTSDQRHKSKRTFLESFMYGAAQRIRTSRVEIVKELEEASIGTELVLMDRAALVKEEFSKMKLGCARGMDSGPMGAGAGYQAGLNSHNGGDKSIAR